MLVGPFYQRKFDDNNPSHPCVIQWQTNEKKKFGE